MKRKAIQISAVPGENNDILFVLFDDGTIWRTWYSNTLCKDIWQQVESFPEKET